MQVQKSMLLNIIDRIDVYADSIDIHFKIELRAATRPIIPVNEPNDPNCTVKGLHSQTCRQSTG